MPFYDLHCAECDKDFNIRASIADRVEGRIACPECGSNRMETIFAPVNYLVKDSAPPACPNRHLCGEACRHER